MQKLRKWAAVLALFAGLSAFGAYTTHEIGQGEAVDLTATGNTANDIYICQGGNTFTLTGTAAADGSFAVKAAIRTPNDVDGATLTFDASGVTGCTSLRWTGHIWTTGAVTVKGVGKIVFGNTSLVSADMISTVLFGARDLTFDGTVVAPEGVVFTNGVTVASTPSCPFSIAKDTFLAVCNGARFGTAGEDLVVEDYTLLVICMDAKLGLAAQAIRVKAGNTCVCRPCDLQLHSEEFWKWGGVEKTLDIPFVLEDATSMLRMQATQGITLSGKISGPGYVQTYNNNCPQVVLSGDLTEWTGSARLYVAKAPYKVVGTYLPELRYLKNGGTDGSSSLQPPGVGSGPTSARIDLVTGLSDEKNRIGVAAQETLTVGKLSGSVCFEGDPTGLVVIEDLPADAKVRLTGGVRLQVLKADPSATVTLGGADDTTPGVWDVAGPASGEAVSFWLRQTVRGGTLACGGQLNLGALGTAYSQVTIKSGTVTASVGEGVPLTFAGGTLVEPHPAWQDKIALWCDATLPESIVDGTHLPNYNPGEHAAKVVVNGNPIVWEWRDCRPEQTRYSFRNKRFSKATDSGFTANVYPYYVPGGSPEVSMMNNSRHLNILDNNNNMASLQTVFAIVVFGGQGGGGGALLGTQDGELARAAFTAGSNASNLSSNNMTTNSFAAYLDGEAVDTAETRFKSGWQIVSIDLGETGLPIMGIGFANFGSNNTPGGRGYNSYAEVMLFTEMPTETERKAIEKMLSEKWNIAISHDGATATRKVFGNGERTLIASETLEGMYTGAVNLNGQRLTVTEGAYPMVAADMPTERRNLWIDPSVDGAIQMGGDADKPLEINAIYQRKNDGSLITEAPEKGNDYYLQSPIMSDGSTDRRAHLSEGSRGGSATKWIDLSNIYGDYAGNNLMISRLPLHDAPQGVASNGWISINYRTLFVVTDTTRGGGTPICHFAGAGSGDVIKRGATPSYTDSIWVWDPALSPVKNTVCKPIILNGTNWLDGVEKSYKDGFSGRPEVFTFEPSASGGTDDATTAVKAFGCYDTTSNEEAFGEIISFNRVLADAERESIEAYLMAKWLGKVKDGFADFREMTVTGAGELVVPSAKAMPKLAAGFTGTVSLAANALSFSFADQATLATDALDVGEHPLALPATVTVNLAFASRVLGDRRYVVMKGDLQDGTTFALGTVTGGGAHAAEGAFAYDAETKTVFYTVPKAGSVILLR